MRVRTRAANSKSPSAGPGVGSAPLRALRLGVAGPVLGAARAGVVGETMGREKILHKYILHKKNFVIICALVLTSPAGRLKLEIFKNTIFSLLLFFQKINSRSFPFLSCVALLLRCCSWASAQGAKLQACHLKNIYYIIFYVREMFKSVLHQH